MLQPFEKRQIQILTRVFYYYSQHAADRCKTFEQGDQSHRTMTFQEFRKFSLDFGIVEAPFNLFASYQKNKIAGQFQLKQFISLLVLIAKNEVSYGTYQGSPYDYLRSKLSLGVRFGWYSQAKIQIQTYETKKITLRKISTRQKNLISPTCFQMAKLPQQKFNRHRYNQHANQIRRKQNQIVNLSLFFGKQSKDTVSNFYISRMQRGKSLT